MYDVPLDTELSAEELTAAVAEALINPRQPRSGAGANTPNLLMSLGLNRAGTEIAPRLWAANGGQNALEFRMEELCWSWIPPEILVPPGQSFFLTGRGRAVLEDVSSDARIVLTAAAFLCESSEEHESVARFYERHERWFNELTALTHVHIEYGEVSTAAEQGVFVDDLPGPLLFRSGDDEQEEQDGVYLRNACGP